MAKKKTARKDTKNENVPVAGSEKVEQQAKDEETKPDEKLNDSDAPVNDDSIEKTAEELALEIEQAEVKKLQLRAEIEMLTKEKNRLDKVVAQRLERERAQQAADSGKSSWSESSNKEISRALGKANPESAQEALNMAAEVAACLPAHAGKSAKQHGTDIARRIRDLLKK